MDRWVDGQIYGWIDRQRDRLIVIWIDVQIDRQIDGQMGGQMDGKIDR